jgi:hypothetical protein
MRIGKVREWWGMVGDDVDGVMTRVVGRVAFSNIKFHEIHDRHMHTAILLLPYRDWRICA